MVKISQLSVLHLDSTYKRWNLKGMNISLSILTSYSFTFFSIPTCCTNIMHTMTQLVLLSSVPPLIFILLLSSSHPLIPSPLIPSSPHPLIPSSPHPLIPSSPHSLIPFSLPVTSKATQIRTTLIACSALPFPAFLSYLNNIPMEQGTIIDQSKGEATTFFISSLRTLFFQTSSSLPMTSNLWLSGNGCGHTKEKAPHPVRSEKLSSFRRG